MHDKNTFTPPSAPLPTEEAIKLLEAHHVFPGPYDFKLIGKAGPRFIESIPLVAGKALGREVPEKCLKVRASSQRSYLAVTLTLELQSASQALSLYKKLREIPDLLILI